MRIVLSEVNWAESTVVTNKSAAARSRGSTSARIADSESGLNASYISAIPLESLQRPAVTNNSANNSQPAWSPDGSKLLFQTDRDGNREIYVMSVDGELIQLTDDAADDLSPGWSPPTAHR